MLGGWMEPLWLMSIFCDVIERALADEEEQSTFGQGLTSDEKRKAEIRGLLLEDTTFLYRNLKFDTVC